VPVVPSDRHIALNVCAENSLNNGGIHKEITMETDAATPPGWLVKIVERSIPPGPIPAKSIINSLSPRREKL